MQYFNDRLVIWLEYGCSETGGYVGISLINRQPYKLKYNLSYC